MGLEDGLGKAISRGIIRIQEVREVALRVLEILIRLVIVEKMKNYRCIINKLNKLMMANNKSIMEIA